VITSVTRDYEKFTSSSEKMTDSGLAATDRA